MPSARWVQSSNTKTMEEPTRKTKEKDKGFEKARMGRCSVCFGIKRIHNEDIHLEEPWLYWCAFCKENKPILIIQ